MVCLNPPELAVQVYSAKYLPELAPIVARLVPQAEPPWLLPISKLPLEREVLPFASTGFNVA